MRNKTRYITTFAFILVSAWAANAAAVDVVRYEQNYSEWYGGSCVDDPSDYLGWQESPTDGDFQFDVPKKREYSRDAAVRLRFFPSAHPVHVVATVNGVSIGNEVKRPGTTELGFRCPPGVIKPGEKNTLEIKQLHFTPDGLMVDVAGEGFDSFDVAFGVPAAGFDWDRKDAAGVTPPDNRDVPEVKRDAGKDGITENEGDYLILTGDAFVTALQPLVNLRAAEGLTVRVITLTQICDWYSANPGDEAIAVRQFLNYAWRYWALKPKYVLLVGTWHRFKEEYRTFPLAYSYDYFEEGVQSDVWFAQIDDGYLDYTPKFALGRIPAVRPQQVSDYVAKVIYYETHLNPTWKNDAVVVGNDVDTWTGEYGGIPEEVYQEWVQLMQDYCSEIHTAIGQTYYPSKILATDYEGQPGRWLAFKNSLDAGKSVGYFVGYANQDIMGQFLNDEGTGLTADLTNVGKYPIFFGSGCTICNMEPDQDNGNPRYLCPDLVLAPNKATIAAVGSTAVSNPQHYIDYLVSTANYLSRSGYDRVGDIHKNAFIYAWNLGEFSRSPNFHYYQSLQLVGDPAIHVLGDRGGMPFLLGGWPKNTYETTDAVAVADITPFLGYEPTTGNGESLQTEKDDVVQGFAALDVAARGGGDVYVWGAVGDQKFRNGGVFGNNTPPLLADIDNDGIVDTVCVSDAVSAIWAFDSTGNNLEGFPVTVPGLISIAPSVGDVNGDGYLDILCVGGTTGESLYAVDHNGDVLPGWPKDAPNVSPGYHFWQTPSVGDVDADGQLEVVFTSRGYESNPPGRLIIVSDDGVEYYSLFGGNISPSRAVLAQLDADPQLEIIVACAKVAPLDETVNNLYRIDNAGGSYAVTWQADAGGDLNFVPCVGDFRPQLTGKEIIVATTTRGTYVGSLKMYCADNGTGIATRALSSDPASSPTVADICEDNEPPDDGYEILLGLPSKLACHRAFAGMYEVPGWNGNLTGSVTTPLVTDLNADTYADIICSDAVSVYAFTTERPYRGLENFDWVRDGHDNLNMGIWDIVAPTAVAVADEPEDQGHKLVLTWAPSVDDGVRSTRVTHYDIYRTAGEAVPPPGGDAANGGNAALSHKLAEGKLAALRRGGVFVEPSNAGVPITSSNPTDAAPDDGMDTDIYLKVATVPAGTYTYEDDNLTNNYVYKYYVVATDGTFKAQRSVIVEGVPHDNIPPDPPSDFGLVVIHGAEPQVNLTWSLSPDDPTGGGSGDAIIAPSPSDRGPAGVVTPSTPGMVGSRVPPGVVSYDFNGGTDVGIGGADGTPSMPIGQKDGDAFKEEIARRIPDAPYVKAPYIPLPYAPVRGGGKDAGAGDVVEYVITKSIQGQPTAAFIHLPAGTTHYEDGDVSYGYIYEYSIVAWDSENASETVGPEVADLFEVPPGGAMLGSVPYAPLTPGNAASRTADAGITTVTTGRSSSAGTYMFALKVKAGTEATFEVYDLAGRKVATLFDGVAQSNAESVTWAADVPAGVYVYSLRTPEGDVTGKVAVTK